MPTIREYSTPADNGRTGAACSDVGKSGVEIGNLLRIVDIGNESWVQQHGIEQADDLNLRADKATSHLAEHLNPPPVERGIREEQALKLPVGLRASYRVVSEPLHGPNEAIRDGAEESTHKIAWAAQKQDSPANHGLIALARSIAIFDRPAETAGNLGLSKPIDACHHQEHGLTTRGSKVQSRSKQARTGTVEDDGSIECPARISLGGKMLTSSRRGGGIR